MKIVLCLRLLCVFAQLYHIFELKLGIILPKKCRLIPDFRKITL